MVETKTTEEVLREIETDLRQDERLWKEMHRDLRSLGVRPPRRTARMIAFVVGALVLLAGSFMLGWFLAPEPEPTPPSVAGTLFTPAGLEAKHAGLVAMYGSEFGRPLISAPVGSLRYTPAGLDAKHAGLVAMYGPAFGEPLIAGPPVYTPTGLDAKHAGMAAMYGSEFGPLLPW